MTPRLLSTAWGRVAGQRPERSFMSAWNLGDITVEVRGGGWVRGPEKSGGLVELCALWVRAAFKP